jgi:formylglycine-generating enzyme required for sulfatase activity
MEKNYHSNAAYGDYPIVNIQYSAALEYCKWLTKEYNATKKRTYTKVKFRLPTEEEWIVATKCLPGGKLPWYGDKGYTSDLKYMANIKFALVEAGGKTGLDYLADNALYMTRVGEYPKNPNDLFDMIGNVAEMVSEEGKAKGGGWNSFISECYVDQSQKYEGWGHPEVGFRLFMEIIEP